MTKQLINACKRKKSLYINFKKIDPIIMNVSIKNTKIN